MKVLEVEALDLVSTLCAETVISYEAEDVAISTIVAALLTEQVRTPAITVGTIDAAIGAYTRSIIVDGDTIWRALMRLRDTAGGYIEVTNDGVLNWSASIGDDTGQEIRYKKNMVGIERSTDYHQLVNRLYCYGRGEGEARIVLSDSDFTAVDYVEDAASQVTWGGIYPGVMVDRSITHPNTLYSWALLMLDERKDAIVSYRVDTIDLSEVDTTDSLDFSFEELQLGSTIKVIDEDLGIDVEVVVVSIEHPDLHAPHRMILELTNELPDFTKTLAGVYDTIQLNNHIATRIGAGQVTVLGGFTVLDWVTGGTTNIDGSNITTGTITAAMLNFTPLESSGLSSDIIATINASTEGLQIQAEMVAFLTYSLEGVIFEADEDTDIVSWTTGDIVYFVGGVLTTDTIAAGNDTWAAGTMYIYYVKEENIFRTTTVKATAWADDNIVLATYQGGNILDILMGRTTISGSDIQTGVITATHIAAGTITTNEINFTPLISSGGSGDIVATINASAEGIRIDADNIHLSVGLETFRQAAIPTSIHEGDLWYDTDDDNKCYRAFAAGVSTIGAAAWVLTQDAIPDATNIISIINLSSEGIDISSSKISISGTTTFAANYDPSDKLEAGQAAADINANVTKIQGDKITTGTIAAATITLGAGASIATTIAGAGEAALSPTGLVINNTSNNAIMWLKYNSVDHMRINSYSNGIYFNCPTASKQIDFLNTATGAYSWSCGSKSINLYGASNAFYTASGDIALGHSGFYWPKLWVNNIDIASNGDIIMTGDVGSAVFYPAVVHADLFTEHCNWPSFQDEDDIALLRQIKTKDGKLDITTFPAAILVPADLDKAEQVIRNKYPDDTGKKLADKIALGKLKASEPAVGLGYWQSLVMGGVLQTADRLDLLEARLVALEAR